MANVLVDLDLVTGSNDGSSWANAYQTWAVIVAAAADIVFVQGTQSTAGVISNSNIAGTFSNPVIILGVVEGTTNDPPIQSDLVPGWRTGETRTEANRAYNDANAPSLTATGSGNDINFADYWYVYGINFVSADDIIFGDFNNGHVFEECSFTVGTASRGFLAVGPQGSIRDDKCTLINCELITTNADDSITLDGSCLLEAIGLLLTSTTALTSGLFNAGSNTGLARLIGCDFSDRAHNLFAFNANQNLVMEIWNTQFHASTTIISGSISVRYRINVHQSVNITGKSSGSIQNVDVLSDAGAIVEEVTAVRTNGADDGNGGWSLAYTPKNNGTRDQYHGLIGPWMAFKIVGDGTAQTVSVNINNSGSTDYNNDDAVMEIMFPSAGGTAQYDHETDQMDLLGTPTAITDDTGSTWGGSLTQAQTLSVSISPDYVGRAYCRVIFFKNFASSPETLYVDPFPVVS